MGVRPAASAGAPGGGGDGGGAEAGACSPLVRSTSARSVGITGRSASLPLSNSLRHSSSTDEGSRRYCSYITCTNAALWVPKTNSLTGSNLTKRRGIFPGVPTPPEGFPVLLRLFAVLLLTGAARPGHSQDLAAVRARLEQRIARAPARAVGLYYRSLERPDSLLIGANLRFHAASTMKIPVMIQIFRDADAGLLALDESLAVHTAFPSLVDGAPFSIGKEDDSDTTLYAFVGSRRSVRDLLERMITRSSNLATNLLIERVGAERAQHSARALGAWSIQVLRGVEDGAAYRAGLNNTTTARDLGALLGAIATGRAASRVACDSMLGILGRQEFNEGVPAGLPPGTRVAHKTGWIGGVVYHDAAIVTPAAAGGYVLVVLTAAVEQDSVAHNLVADVSRLVYAGVVR